MIMREDIFNIGDLIKLKGFKKLDINDTPVGIIIANLGISKFKINWADEKIAKRFGLTEIMHKDKIELISATKHI
tara:strand:- start:3224 stop:3448 length:225 start_codon:yes stop_codon:yes gene_type:complete